MPNVSRAREEAEIRVLIGEMTKAWRRGDANAYGARYQTDATFTNLFGDFYVGREEFDRRHAEVFRGIFKDAALTMNIRKVRPDVALEDVVTTLSGAKAQPTGAEPGPDGTLSSSLLMVLTKEAGRWEIAAYHNVWRAAPR
jgi:uncharacterized protein (TIGR02246 family)